MKFCQICGRPLEEGEVCNCRAQQAQADPGRSAQPRYQQPAQPQGAPQQPYRQPAPAQPKPDGQFVKALKNIPIAFRSYFKNSDKVIETAKAKKDFLLPLLYIAILFLVNLILGICFFARMTSYTYWMGLGNLAGVFGSVNAFNFGLVLVGALIMTVVECALYTGARFLSQVIFKKAAPFQALTDSFIEFGFHSIVLSCLLLAAALLGLITAWLIPPLAGFGASYLVVCFITAGLKDAEGYQNKLARNLILTGCVMLCIALAFWLAYAVCSMNYSYRAMSYSGYNYADLLNSLN